MRRLQIGLFWDFVEIAHAAVSPCPPISLTRIVARTEEGYTYAAELWALRLVQGPFSAAPQQPDSQLVIAVSAVRRTSGSIEPSHDVNGVWVVDVTAYSSAAYY
jgi:hypothetical protein